MKSPRLALLPVFAIAAAAAPLGLADAPLPPPGPITACSPSKTYCAVSDPKQGTRAFRLNRDGTRSPLWSLPGWHRVLFIADDGHVAATGLDGILLPLDFKPDLTLVTFWRDGVKVAEAPLSAVVEDLGKLTRTVSHYRWGGYIGFDEQGRFVVDTIEQRGLRIDPATGKPVPR